MCHTGHLQAAIAGIAQPAPTRWPDVPGGTANGLAAAALPCTAGRFGARGRAAGRFIGTLPARRVVIIEQNAVGRALGIVELPGGIHAQEDPDRGTQGDQRQWNEEKQGFHLLDIMVASRVPR